MLIYTHKLEKYLRRKIIPKILINPSRYYFLGSFGRRVPYVTDVDIDNDVYPQINRKNIYLKIVKLLNSLRKEKRITFIYAVCGTDDRFRVDSIEDLSKLDTIRLLLSPDEQRNLDNVLNKYQDEDKLLLFVNEILKPYLKLKWSYDDIINNLIILPGGQKVLLTNVIGNQSRIVLKYYIMVGSHPLGIDVAVYYNKVDKTKSYEQTAFRDSLKACYLKEYYYLLLPLRRYFKKKDKKIYQEIDDIIDKKYGLYRQIVVRTEMYHVLYKRHLLNIETATIIVLGIIKDLTHPFSSIKYIKKASYNNTAENKMREWDLLLGTLSDEVNAYLSNSCQEDYYRYLSLVSEKERGQYCDPRD